MGCGTSREVPVVNEDAPGHYEEEGPDTQPPNTEELTSVNSTSPDRDSRPIKSPSSPSPILRSNGTNGVDHQHLNHPLSAPESPTPDKTPEGEMEEDDLHLPLSGGGRAIAFEVAPQEDEGESLIKRHPPRKFQKLEDQQQQNPSLTQEILEEKQAIAEKRRQEILTQRVQSAKTRTARSAGGRLRARGSEADEVDQLEDGDIEGASTDMPENEL